jgi:NADH-quinone oxidoreductase subunit A
MESFLSFSRSGGDGQRPVLLAVPSADDADTGRVAARLGHRNVASWFVGRHRNSATKLAAYECGIVASGDARSRFSVRFYLVAVLFILFDVEAVFIMPWALIYREMTHTPGLGRFFGFWEMIVYLGFVAVGLYYILRKGILNWSQDRGDL